MRRLVQLASLASRRFGLSKRPYDFDEIVRENESGQWASVGVIRPSGGGPVVIYVYENQGVTETQLDLFTADEAYAAFRISSLEAVRAESYDLGPMALVWPVFAECSVPAQPIAIDEGDTTRKTTIIDARTIMALAEKREAVPSERQSARKGCS